MLDKKLFGVVIVGLLWPLSHSHAADEAPSMAMLEFLAEFGSDEDLWSQLTAEQNNHQTTDDSDDGVKNKANLDDQFEVNEYD